MLLLASLVVQFVVSETKARIFWNHEILFLNDPIAKLDQLPGFFADDTMIYMAVKSEGDTLLLKKRSGHPKPVGKDLDDGIPSRQV